MSVSLNNGNKPAPAWLRKLVNALQIVLIPAIGAAVTQLPDSFIDKDGKIVLGIAVTIFMALIRVLELTLAEDGDTPQP